uniref:APC membrane recruitment protein 2 n=1 Tax=Gadus morhua TaxID=8049 RepID=A0A8C5FPT3_GADMO
ERATASEGGGKAWEEGLRGGIEGGREREKQQAGVRVMEVQSECGEPPADPQPTGKINKAAFKLFGKRRTGSGMAGFFSFRNKGAVTAPVELVRSKTHDGLPTGPDGPGSGEALGGGGGGRGGGGGGGGSFSFFSFLRRGSLRTAESGGAGLARRGRGLKGLFSSMRWRRGRDRTSEPDGGGGGGGEGAAPADEAQEVEGSPARRPLPSSQLTRSAFSSIASSPPPSLSSRAQVSPPQPEHVTGSGVVAYMGGGEEMASPEGVDDADMQGLWHMLPSTGDNSPALLRPHQGATTARKTPQVKTLGLSKIPVVGAAGSRGTAKPPPPAAHHHTYGARQPTSPGEKELLSDEGYWDTPTATPTATPVDEGIQRSERIILSRDSCSGDNLYDLYNDPEEEDKEDDLSSTPSPSTEYKLSPSSQTTPPSSSSSPPSFRSLKGSTSLPRDSKIPLSVRQSPPPPHSVSQSSLPSVLEASAAQPKTQAPPPARTRIPVSKVPVRRSGQNKPGNASRGTAHRK